MFYSDIISGSRRRQLDGSDETFKILLGHDQIGINYSCATTEEHQS